jgi:NAD(P)H-flavin reductase
MRPPQRCQVQLVEKIEHNAKFIQYYFEYQQPATAEFDAGQYASLQVSERGDRRSYSICSTPDKTHGFELLVDISPGGVGSQFLSKLEYGQTVHALVPLGVFTLSHDPSEEALVFVATGSGIAPFRSMIQHLLQTEHSTIPIYLHWGMRFADDLFWLEEWQQLADAFPNFHFHPVISKPDPNWTLCQGRVTDCLSVHEMPVNAGYYLCGNKPMIVDTMALLQTKGVTPEHIHHEKFY